MLRPRIIPCLLIRNGGLVKTIGFSNAKYVGDPINAVRIFNEKEVDELIVADIDATTLGCEPNYKLIEQLAAECRMPLCYAGGIKRPEQVERIIALGVEKVGISSAAIESIDLISECAHRVGSQSIVVVMDVRRLGQNQKYELFTRNGTYATGVDPVQFAISAEEMGAGEILINSIDFDGKMSRYDLALIELVRNAVNLPLSALGGCGSFGDIEGLIHQFGAIGAVAGSFFVFKGKYRAVLIQYPNSTEKETLYAGLKNSFFNDQ